MNKAKFDKNDPANLPQIGVLSGPPDTRRSNVAGLLALLLLAACSSKSDAPATATPDSLIRLMDAEIKSLDPQKASDLSSIRVASDIFEGLTRYNGKGEVEAGLAASWSVSNDGLQWRFDLKPNLQFSDGTPIDAYSFQSVFERLTATDTASPNASLFDVVKHFKALSPTSLVVTLSQPFPALAELLAHPAVAALPIHRIAKSGDNWTKERPLTASGAYQLEQWVLHDRIILKPNRSWHEGLPAIQRVEWRPVDDRQTAFRQFRANEAHLVSDFPSGQYQWIQSNKPGQAHVSPYRGVYYFVFNTRRPPFNDKRVRQALNLTVERHKIAQHLMLPGTPPAWGVIPPGIDIKLTPYRPSWAEWSHEKRNEYARNLLAMAGYSRAKPLRFEIRFNSDIDHRRVTLALLDNWKQLPVEAHILNTEATLHFASLRNGDFDLARSGWIGDLSIAENFLAVHKSNAGPINYSGYNNPRFDLTLSHAATLHSPDKRADALRQAETLLMNDAPVLPVYYYVSKNLVSPHVSGWHDNLANVHPSRSLSLRTP